MAGRSLGGGTRRARLTSARGGIRGVQSLLSRCKALKLLAMDRHVFC